MSHTKLLLVFAMTAASMRAQPLAFEVASIKPNNTQTRGMGVQFLPGGRFVAHNIPLRVIVTVAYDLPFQSNRLSGTPETEPLLRQSYDIEAAAEKGAIPVGSAAKVRGEKLADRFKMTVRRETKDTSAYAIVVAQNGPKLQPAKLEEKDCPEDGVPGGCRILNGGQGRGLHGTAVNVSDIALFVSNWTAGWTSMQLRDGIAGVGEDGIPDTDRPTLFAVMAQLGLKLEAQKAPVDFFVVEHVEKPVGN